MIACCGVCAWNVNGICEIDDKKVDKLSCCGAWLKSVEEEKFTLIDFSKIYK